MLAHSLFHHRPHASRPQSKLETALHKADASINRIIQLLEAAQSPRSVAVILCRTKT